MYYTLTVDPEAEPCYTDFASIDIEVSGLEIENMYFAYAVDNSTVALLHNYQWVSLCLFLPDLGALSYVLYCVLVRF